MADDVLVFVEQRAGRVHPASWQMFTLAPTLSGQTGGRVHAVVVGEGVADLAEPVARRGAVRVHLCMYPIFAFGRDAQKERWRPPMARGEIIGCFGLTEPDGGSDPGSMKTRAVRDGGDWVINGSKAWITNGTIADLAVVWAMTDDGIRGFLVERGTTGYTARDMLGASGISVELCPIRHMLDLESVITYEGTETIHELVVGHAITGHRAF